nr:unnamed protein product [Callosobruchus chinensis]
MPTVEPLRPGPHIQNGDQACQPPVRASSFASKSRLLVAKSNATASSAVASVRTSGFCSWYWARSCPRCHITAEKTSFLAAFRVFTISIATVIGPTPPGTGVM